MASKQKFGLEGFSRVKIKQDGKLVGDSGWVHNTITDYGLDEGLGRHFLATNSGVVVAAVAIGTGAAPATNDTGLAGEITDATNSRDIPTLATVTTSDGSGVTAQYYGTFSSSENRLTTDHDISNIGLYDQTATDGGTLLSGAAYNSSNFDTNQDLEYTYEWRFATTT